MFFPEGLEYANCNYNILVEIDGTDRNSDNNAANEAPHVNSGNCLSQPNESDLTWISEKDTDLLDEKFDSLQQVE